MCTVLTEPCSVKHHFDLDLLPTSAKHFNFLALVCQRLDTELVQGHSLSLGHLDSVQGTEVEARAREPVTSHLLYKTYTLSPSPAPGSGRLQKVDDTFDLHGIRLHKTQADRGQGGLKVAIGSSCQDWVLGEQTKCCLLFGIRASKEEIPGRGPFLGLVQHIRLPAIQNPLPTHLQPHKHQVLPFEVFFPFPLFRSSIFQDHELLVSNLITHTIPWVIVSHDGSCWSYLWNI